MKIAVLSDVHGNVPALESVLDDIDQWAPDEVVVNGDLVSRGPYSLGALQLMQSRHPSGRYLQGNHESFVLSCAEQELDPADPASELSRFAHWTAGKMGTSLDQLRSWPDHFDLTDLDGGSLHITHGSRLGNRSGILPHTDDDELERKLGDPRDLFIGSHTHRPLIRRFAGRLVVNTGSVGQPFDDDVRASYGRFEFRAGRWQAEIARVAYDRDQAIKDFHESGFVEECGPLARLIFEEFRRAQVHVGYWMRRYRQAVKSGHISVEAAIDEYMSEL